MTGRMHMRRGVMLMAVAVLTTMVSALSACPVCDGETGQQVRAGIMDENFIGTIVAVLLPFPILLACVAMIHFGWPNPGLSRRRIRTKDAQ